MSIILRVSDLGERELIVPLVICGFGFRLVHLFLAFLWDMYEL